MNTFNGTFDHNLDSKNRLFVPTEFKELISGRLMIRLGITEEYRHIDCFLEDDFEQVVLSETAEAQDEQTRKMLDFKARAYCKALSVDNGGRICLPATILSKAGITKSCTVIGSGKYFQIWNPQLLDEYNESIFEASAARSRAKKAAEDKYNEYMSAGYFFDVKNTLALDIERMKAQGGNNGI